MQISIPVVGPSYTSRSLDVGSQVTRNFYFEVNNVTQEPAALMPFPGLTLFSSTGAGAVRGLGELKGVLYSVTGNRLYRIGADGSSTDLGFIGGSGRCVLTSDGNHLVITTGVTKPYIYDGADLIATVGEGLPNAYSSAFINQRVVYDAALGNLVFTALKQPATAGLGSVLNAESNPDDVIFVWSFKQQLYAAGTKTIQPFWNSGRGEPPYSPVTNAVQQVGVQARYSISTNRELTYFLGSDLRVYQYDGLSVSPVDNPALGSVIRKYQKTDDAFGMCFTFDSMNFYLLSFPTGGSSWLYNESVGLWTNLAEGTEGGQTRLGHYQNTYGKHLVSDRRNGNIYELDFNNYTNNGDMIQRQRDTIVISAKELNIGRPNTRMTMNWLKLVVEQGVSEIDRRASILMQYSDDHGKTWSSELRGRVGALGDYQSELYWGQLGSFRERMFRFTMTDPVKWVLIDAIADVEVQID